MLEKINRLYQSLFPPRQLLIRQNGEVKHISASGKAQFSIALVGVVALGWVSYSNISYFALNDKISQTTGKLRQSQTSLSQLSSTYQQSLSQLSSTYLHKQAVLEQQLLQVQQQQQLLQNLLDSLPSSVSPVVEAEPKVTTDDAVTETENSTANIITTNVVLAKMQQTQASIDQLTLAQQQSYSGLAYQINKRQQLLEQAMLATGVTTDAVISKQQNQALAQGGPLNNLSDQRLVFDTQNLLDKLFKLIELENSLSNIPIIFPAKDYYISSHFGIRKDPLLKRAAMHKGIDMAGWIKTKIFAPANGTVRRAGKNGSYGRFIEIDHHNGFMTRYGHLHKIMVKKGQKIGKSDVIGLMGSSGRSTSTHLHYEILFNKQQINPLTLIKALANVL